MVAPTNLVEGNSTATVIMKILASKGEKERGVGWGENYYEHIHIYYFSQNSIRIMG
jgi:hypothetical protein